MNKYLVSILSALLLIFSSGILDAQTVVYGYAPYKIGDSQIQAQGSGKNKYIEVCSELDPLKDPAFARLEGSKIVGVRVFLESAYEQEESEFSSITLRKGSLASEKVKKLVDFDKGWNEIKFDSPITIEKGQKYYVGAEVFELQGHPYPFASYADAQIKGSFFSCIDRNGQWSDYSKRGAVLLQALIEPKDPKVLDHTVSAAIVNPPTLVAPNMGFDAQLYIRNCSSQKISKIHMNVFDPSGKVSEAEYTFKEPIEPFDAKVINQEISTGTAEGSDVGYHIAVDKVDGVAAQQASEPVTSLYVTVDAYKRIVLIEEFTSQRCPNCPFMAYYLAKAKNSSSVPHLFVAHHAGFQHDAFTQPLDDELLFFFGGAKNAFNPAAMFDRRTLKEFQTPIVGARQSSPDPYLTYMEECYRIPAQAQVLVDKKVADGKIGCTVHGKVSKFALDKGSDYYLSCYLVEDSIPFSKYSQDGPKGKDVPKDVEKVIGGHSGVIRHVFCEPATGMRLQVREDHSFSIDFPAVKIDDSWVVKNCQVIAFIHKYDPDNLDNNEVLNAGSDKMNKIALGIPSIPAVPSEDILVEVRDGQILPINVEIANIRIFSMSGALMDVNAKLPSGTYIVVSVDCSLNPVKVFVR